MTLVIIETVYISMFAHCLFCWQPIFLCWGGVSCISGGLCTPYLEWAVYTAELSWVLLQERPHKLPVYLLLWLHYFFVS